jgi:hypothetical protein
MRRKAHQGSDMKRRKIFWMRLTILSLLLVCLAACGSPSTELVLIPVGPTPVKIGETLQFTATRGEVIWNIIGGTENGSIDPFGLYTAPQTLPSDPNITIMGQSGGDTSFAFITLQE